MYMPQIIEQTGRSKKEFDLVSKLYCDSSTIILFEEIDNETSFKIIAQLLYLDSLDNSENIKLYICSPGGIVTAGLAIIDTIESMTRKVDTIGIGEAASMAAIILLMGTGIRRALKNTRVMLHSIQGGFVGDYHDHKISFEEEQRLQKILMKMISDKTGIKLDEVKKMTERDKFLSVNECIKLNLLDSVI